MFRSISGAIGPFVLIPRSLTISAFHGRDSECSTGQLVVEVDDNGKTMVRVIEGVVDLSNEKGQIALQAEGSEVEFRKLTLTDISSLSEQSP